MKQSRPELISLSGHQPRDLWTIFDIGIIVTGAVLAVLILVCEVV